jgi:pyruvate dehydrogenase E1 component beta subunit
VSAEVIDLRTILRWTWTPSSPRPARPAAVVAHEAQVDFGVGAEISARLHKELFGQLKAPVARVGAARSPVPFSKPLETAFVPTRERILAAIRETLK